MNGDTSSGMASHAVAAPPRPLRVAVLADAAQVPRHVAESFRQAIDAPWVNLVGIYFLAQPPEATWPDRLFTGLDRIEDLAGRGHGRRSGAFEPVDLATALAARRLGPVDLARVNQRLVLKPAGLDVLIAQGLDVLIACTQSPLVMPHGITRHGVIGIEVGAGVPATAVWAGAAEVAGGCPVMTIRLIDYAAANAEVSERYVATTHVIGSSPPRNRSQALRKGAAALRRLLQTLGQGPAGRVALPRLLDRPDAGLRAVPPSAGLFARACGQMARQWLQNRIDRKTGYDLWHLAYCFSDRALPEIEFDRLRYLAPRPGTFWADPFPLCHAGRHYILFEELPFDSLRGRLLAVEVSEHGPAGEPMPVLERDYHLSYPQVFHWQGELYMVPETKAAKRVELLRCVDFPSRWEAERVLLDDVRAVDATLHQSDGSWWMFVNLALEGMDSADELHLYHADSLFGDWRPHPGNPLCADVRCARPAGPLFEADGSLFRPSQDGSTTYGAALWINRIERLDRMGFVERPFRRIAPDWHPDVRTVHTLGRAGRLTVLDCVVDDRGGLAIQHCGTGT